MIPDNSKLDNPAWYSLAETHAPLSVGIGSLRCYLPDVCPFGGYQDDPARIASALKEFSHQSQAFYLIGERPACPQNLTIDKELVCLQMCLDKPMEQNITEQIVPLNNNYALALHELVNLVQPGYFLPGTIRMGDYFGIFKEDRLVAVTGERMKMEGFTEISAVVTHPDHTGKGYARQLMTYTIEKIFRENREPYLHVAESNQGAITLYEKLGFRTRRKISFWHLITR